MKFAEHADVDEYAKTIKYGALKGAIVGLTAGSLLGLYLKTRTSFFAGHVGGYQKVFIFAAPAAFCSIVNMELNSRDFEVKMREKQHGEANVAVKPVIQRSFSTDVVNWFDRNKYKVIVGGWAASLAGSFWIVKRDPFLTRSQKIVQARVYAQGLTVAMLLASVFMGVTDKSDKMQKASYASKSWERDIEYVETANHPHGMYSSEQENELARQAEDNLNIEKHPRAAGNDKKVENDVKSFDKDRAEKATKKAASGRADEAKKREQPKDTAKENVAKDSP